jgi:hypothetical protein
MEIALQIRRTSFWRFQREFTKRYKMVSGQRNVKLAGTEILAVLLLVKKLIILQCWLYTDTRLQGHHSNTGTRVGAATMQLAYLTKTTLTLIVQQMTVSLPRHS